MPDLMVRCIGAHTETHEFELDHVGGVATLKGVEYGGSGIRVEIMIEVVVRNRSGE